MTTAATLGESALRQLGVAVVPVAERPALAAPVDNNAIADTALRLLGVEVVPEADRPALAAAVPAATIAETALRLLGVTVVPDASRPALAAPAVASTVGTLALAALGVISAEETPSASDAALALTHVSAVHDSLVSQGSASWLLNAIPNGVLDDYVILAAMRLASSFGKQADPARGPEVEARVRRVSQVMRALADATAAVSKVHDGLVANGSVPWALTAIPNAAADDYATLAMLQLAPSFGEKVDPAQQPVVEMRVRRIAQVMRATDDAVAAVSAAHDALVAQGSVSWALGAIPNAVSDDYAVLAALQLAPAFGQKADPARQPVVEARIRKVAAIMRAPDDAEAAVVDVHTELAATNRVRWSISDIPRMVERAYVDLAANLLAPLFGMKADPAGEMSARRLLAQAIALPTSGERTQAEYF